MAAEGRQEAQALLQNSAREGEGEEGEDVQGGDNALVLIASFAAAFGSISFGFGQGFSAPAEKYMTASQGQCASMCMDEDEWSTFTGSMNIGAVAGAAVGGPLADRLGRKLSMVASTVPLLVGWMMQGMASSMTELLVGRIAVGVGIGVVSCVVPVYLAEIAPTSIRGALASLHEMGIMMGVLAVYAMGTNAVGIGWRGLSFAGMIPAGFLLAGMLAVPETPRWLVSEGRKSTAKKALRRLRRTEEVDAELWEIERTYLAVAEEPQARLNDLIDKEHRGALIVAVGLMLAQQLSGVNAIIGYSDQILLEAGMKDADVAAVLVAGLQAVATFFAVMFMDSGGRRLLLFISSGGMSASAFVLGMAFLLENHLGAAKGYLATGGCMVFVISYALGLGAIPWIIMGEIFTSRAKGMGSAVAVIVNWGMAAIIMATYEVGANMIHDYGMFFLYSGFLVLGIIFTAIFVPETKNRSLEQIQDSLQQPLAERVRSMSFSSMARAA